MDLGSMLNSDGADNRKPAQPAPPPLPPSHVRHAQPTTPLTTAPPHAFHEFRTPPQAIAGRSYSAHDYAGANSGPAAASPYGGSPPAAYPPSYGQRPPVLAPQPPRASVDMQSPVAIRPTPTEPTRQDSAGYFHIQPSPMSPEARQGPYHQPPPYQHGDVYGRAGSQTSAAPPVVPPTNGAPYGQYNTQTPPVMGPNAAHPYPQHQRSLSIQSTPTPTSAHSQSQFGLSQMHTSPTFAQQQIPRADSMRQTSQPPTPLGPPMPGSQRSSLGPGSFAQPPSPLQSRTSASAASQPYPQPHASPSAARQPSISRLSHPQQSYDASMESQHRPQSQSSRSHSLSVSPKTRVPSLPSSAGNQSMSAESDPRHFQPPRPSALMDMERERGITPAKRKLDERGIKAEELDTQPARPPPFGTNGDHVPSQAQVPIRGASTSSFSGPPRKRRRFHPTVPIWAARYEGRGHLNSLNMVLRKDPRPHLNGDAEVKGESGSRHASPETARSTGGGAHSQKGIPVRPSPEEETLAILGPWEPSFTKIRPLEEIPKKIADWLFLDAVQHPALQEIMSRGIQFEIEAKLGTIISRDTNDRVHLPVASEVLLQDDGRLAFRSSMTEAQHKSFNEWFNQLVINTDPRHPDAQAQNRVQIIYQHRRETDKFYELPTAMQNRLPGAVRSLMKRSAKVRVTYDQKTQRVLAAIVKVRVSDQHLHFPDLPLDCRFSLNLEMPWPDSVEELEGLGTVDQETMPDRNKDRLSYSQSHYQIDLTQVTQSLPGVNHTQRIEKEHELEIELASPALFEQANRLKAGAPHRYPQLIEGFVDNVRLLARKSLEFGA